jgi:hypothetical protein
MLINDYAADLAAQMGLKLSKVSIEDGLEADCKDAFLMELVSGKKHVNALVYRSDLDELKHSKHCDRLEVRLRTALARLQLLLAP